MVEEVLSPIRETVRGTSYEQNLWLVGGCVRDQHLGLPVVGDLDMVTLGSSSDLAWLLFRSGASSIAPVTYERFGTAMVQVAGTQVELVTARRESYSGESRKPDVEPASIEEDAMRRDFTCNTLLQDVMTGRIVDPLGLAIQDIGERVLRTPLDPIETFVDDPLRMLRAVRFRWKLGFTPAAGLYEAIRATRDRLQIVSMERIRDELVKILQHVSAPDAMQDLMDLGLLDLFAPEFRPLVGCEQGKYHFLNTWEHTLLVLRNMGPRSTVLSLACLLHDIGKPSTRFVDQNGDTRFFGHEEVGGSMSRHMLRRLRFPHQTIDSVSTLVRNHMRLGTAKVFTPTAARRVLRDLGDLTDDLVELVEADASALRPGVRATDLTPIRETLRRAIQATPRTTLESPISGNEIMLVTGLPQGKRLGAIKNQLRELVLDGLLMPDDKEAARKKACELAEAGEKEMAAGQGLEP